jgi:hypothetical protein
VRCKKFSFDCNENALIFFREVATHFQANLASIEKNLASLNQRMEALQIKK